MYMTRFKELIAFRQLRSIMTVSICVGGYAKVQHNQKNVPLSSGLRFFTRRY